MMNELLWTLEEVTLPGSGRPRLEGVSLEMSAGVTAVIGYSGAGKTSLLNLLVGFEQPAAGRVTFHAPRDQGRLPLFWAPQNGGLWPHLTVGEHLRAVLPPGVDTDCRTAAILDDFDLRENHDRRPDRLSQGERSRLALARGVASEAAVLVLDEPLVHVDPARVGKYRDVLARHCRETDASLVIATHAPEAVLSEAKRVVCLKEGRVLYAGPVDELYCRPQTEELATFLGPVNWLSPEEAQHWINKPTGRGPWAGDDKECCVRPEQLIVAPADDSPLVVEAARFAGSVAEVDLCHEPTGRRRRFFHRPPGNHLKPGDRVSLQVWLTLLLACLLLTGCGGGGGGPELTFGEVRYWNMPPDEGRMPSPRGMAVGPDDEVYVLDTAGRVLVFNENGRVVRQWRMPESDVGRPEGGCVLKDGRFAVADTHYQRIVFFDRLSGEVVGMLGRHGRGPGEFIYPVAITQDDDENFYVCEYGSNDRVQKFSKDGMWLTQFGRNGTGPGEFDRPTGLAWHAGRVYVSDATNNRVHVFSESGEFLRVLDRAEEGAGLHYPYDLACGPQGDVYVIEYGASRLSKFNGEGKLLGRFGRPGGCEREFSNPWGLTVNSHGRILVADTGNRRIVELRP